MNCFDLRFLIYDYTRNPALQKREIVGYKL